MTGNDREGKADTIVFKIPESANFGVMPET